MLIPAGRAHRLVPGAGRQSAAWPGLHVGHGAGGRQGGRRAGIRANGHRRFAAIRAITHPPIIGIDKVWNERLPGLHHAGFRSRQPAVAEAGADIIAYRCDAALPRDGEPVDLPDRRASGTTCKPEVFADIATVEEARAAEGRRCDLRRNDLAGYTEETAPEEAGPDFELLAALVAGDRTARSSPRAGSTTPEQAAEAFGARRHAVVVGTAITNPREITKRFVAALGPAS